MEKLRFSELCNNTELYEQTDYGIEFDTGIEINHEKYNNILNMVSSNSGIINLGNYIGTIEFMGKPIKVLSKKIKKDDYENMLMEITRKMVELPFDFNSPTYEPVDINMSTSGRILYHAYLILRYIIKNDETCLEQAFQSILANPCRKNENEQQYCNAWEASNITPDAIYSIITRPDNFHSLDRDNIIKNTSLFRKLNINEDAAYFPGVVKQTKITISFDTPENRFVKNFLKICLDILYNFKRKIVPINMFNKIEVENDIKKMSELLEELLSHHIFGEVGEMRVIPSNSTILQKRNGYKDVLAFYNMLQSALYIQMFQEKTRLIIENKDIAELYEIWTYFKLIEIIEELTGMPSCKAGIVAGNDFKAYVQQNICVVFNIGRLQLKIWYNKTFTKNNGSYSLTLRPDIVIEISNDIYIFDAKFKLQNINWDGVEEEKDFTFKNGDVYKMHTYKDAIDNVRVACILYPNPNGKKMDMFWENEDELYGVGALPLLPGIESEGLKEIVKRILERAARTYGSEEYSV